MHIDMGYDGVDIRGAGPLWLGTAVWLMGSIGISRCIGLTREVARTRRFFERGSVYVSGPRSNNLIIEVKRSPSFPRRFAASAAG